MKITLREWFRTRFARAWYTLRLNRLVDLYWDWRKRRS